MEQKQANKLKDIIKRHQVGESSWLRSFSMGSIYRETDLFVGIMVCCLHGNTGPRVGQGNGMCACVSSSQKCTCLNNGKMGGELCSWLKMYMTELCPAPTSQSIVYKSLSEADVHSLLFLGMEIAWGAYLYWYPICLLLERMPVCWCCICHWYAWKGNSQKVAE